MMYLAIRQIDGVQNAEGAYSTDVMCGEGEKQKVLHVESVNETVNQITVTEGKIPEKSGGDISGLYICRE